LTFVRALNADQRLSKDGMGQLDESPNSVIKKSLFSHYTIRKSNLGGGAVTHLGALPRE